MNRLKIQIIDIYFMETMKKTNFKSIIISGKKLN